MYLKHPRSSLEVEVDFDNEKAIAAVISTDVNYVETATAGIYKSAPRWTGKVGDGKAYATTIARVIDWISCRNTGTAAAPNYEAGLEFDAPAAQFNTYFVDRVAAQTFTFAQYQYVSGTNAAGNANVWSNSNAWNMQYATFAGIFPANGSVATDIPSANKLANPYVPANGAVYYQDTDAQFLASYPQAVYGVVDGSFEITKFVIAKNDNLAEGNGTLESVAANIFVTGKLMNTAKDAIDKDFIVNVVSKANNNADYVEESYALPITVLHPKATNPATLDRDVPSIIKIKALTAFGKEKEIQIPFTLKK